MALLPCYAFCCCIAVTNSSMSNAPSRLLFHHMRWSLSIYLNIAFRVLVRNRIMTIAVDGPACHRGSCRIPVWVGRRAYGAWCDAIEDKNVMRRGVENCAAGGARKDVLIVRRRIPKIPPPSLHPPLRQLAHHRQRLMRRPHIE